MTPRIFHAPELFVLRVGLTAVLLDATLIAARGLAVDIPAYGRILGLVALLLAVGYAYRHSGRSEAIAATAIGAGSFILFTSALSLFNYLLLPNTNPTIDALLIRWDAALGHDWPSAIAWAARHPVFNELMRLAYISTLAQIALLVVVLGLTRRIAELHALVVTLTIAGTITVVFWGFFPTAGPTALETASPELLAAVRPVLGQDYGAEIMALIRDGAPLLSPNDLRGLIAFPSFHTVLALAATYYARTVRWLLAVLLPVNIVVLPAITVHGAHHMVDIGGGIAVLFLAIACTRWSAEPKTSAAPALA